MYHLQGKRNLIKRNRTSFIHNENIFLVLKYVLNLISFVLYLFRITNFGDYLEMEKIYSKTNLRQKLKKFLIMTVFIFGLDGKILIENLKQREDNVFLEVFRSFGAI